MNKLSVASVTVMSVIALAVGLFTGGCDLTPEQVSVISQNAGLFSAVGWIAVDNPDKGAIDAVKSILVNIEEKAADVEAGSTYTAALYPEVEKVINKDVEPQYRPLCKAGAIALLGGLDMLFAANPSWKANQDTVIKVVDAFILGAKNGLSMSEDHEVMKAARNQAATRARVIK